MEESSVTKEKLEAYLKDKFPQRENLTVTELERVQGGYSFLTYFFTASWKEAQGTISESLVIRMEPEHGCVPPYDVRPQYEVMNRLQGTGIPVPSVHWLEMDSRVLGKPFFVLEKIEGAETLLSAYMRYPEHQEQLNREYAPILAKLHQLDWQALGLSVLGVPENNRHYAEKEIARWEWVLEDTQYGPQPMMTELISWLKNNIPPAERTTLCHGDYFAHNFLARDGHVVSLLDWEMVGIGDPISDIAWSCMFMNNIVRMFWNEADFIRSYEETAGVKINKEAFNFWYVLANVKLAVIGFAGIKSGLTSEVPDMQHLGLYTWLMPVLQDSAARTLGF